MPEKPSLDTLNAELERAGKMLDGCATMIRDNPEIDSANVRNIAEALLAVHEITSEIYKVRPDLMPDFLKPEPMKSLYAEFEVNRTYPSLVERIEATNKKSRRLRELVLAPEILVMPGAWDPLSAILFERLGFQAIQAGSAAIAAMWGLPDGEIISREQAAQATAALADAVAVPVNADGERGYGGPEEIAATVVAFVEAGAAGMNLEDSIPDSEGRGLAPISEHLEKIAAVMETKRGMGSKFFLNARVDVFAIMRDDPKAALAEAITRGNAYAGAGGDCIFYLGVSDRETLATLVEEVAAPISAFAVADTPSVAELQGIGVARVSYGSAFQRAALAALKRFAEQIREPDGHAMMRQAMSSRELQEMLRGR